MKFSFYYSQYTQAHINSPIVKTINHTCRIIPIMDSWCWWICASYFFSVWYF